LLTSGLANQSLLTLFQTSAGLFNTFSTRPYNIHLLALPFLLSTLKCYRAIIVSSIQALPFFNLASQSGSVRQILGQSDFFFLCFVAALPFWPQSTIPPEIPQLVAIPNVTMQVNQTPVRGAIHRLGMKIRVSIGIFARSFFDSLFFSCSITFDLNECVL
jgi:hypothetical protein